MYLSKTDFIKSLDCQSLLWFAKHQPEILSLLSETELWRMEEGIQFEKLVRQLFSDGLLINDSAEKAAGKAQRLINDGAECLFQATVIADGCLAKTDILVKYYISGGSILNVVKSSNE